MKNTKATTVKTLFSRTTSITKYINAKEDLIWKILIDACAYTQWNSTITKFEGKIAKGEKLLLKSYLDDKRTFKLKVMEFEPNRTLVWGDAMGKRTFILKPHEDGTLFEMKERIGGPLFPLFSKMIPPFDEAFEKFMKDLETEVLNRKNSDLES